MSDNNNQPFIFIHAVTLPSAAAERVWEAWSDLANWQRWDASLKGTEASSNGLLLGKGFQIIPLHGPAAIPVSVTALIDGVHFTTTAITPLGLLSFGHTLTRDERAGTVSLQHSICALPATASSAFPPPLLQTLQNDIVTSVNELSRYVGGGDASV